ncbi:MAG: DUF2852 domain-containing protein [Maritimibacter sp.]
MSSYADPQFPPASGWLSRTESWLDARGKGAWMALMVLGMIFVWPIGLALLFYMIWSKKMFAQSCGARRHRHAHRHAHHHGRYDEAVQMGRRHGFRSSGNSAFDAYKADTLKRLMDEQEQFETFLDRLRQAKDKSEFDQFMDERVAAASEARSVSEVTEDGASDDEVLKEPKK